MNSLAVVLKRIREKRNFTQAELAKRAGVASGTIGEIEAGRNKSTSKTLEKICGALKLTVEERNELFSCLVPDDVSKIIRTKQKDPVDELIESAYYIFYNDDVSDEIKRELKEKLDEAFFMAKIDAKYRDKK
ncbi:MAG: helix-turn-helix domain-containing protein [Fusobacteriaceae bacterium]